MGRKNTEPTPPPPEERDQGSFTDMDKKNPVKQWWAGARNNKFWSNPYVEASPLGVVKYGVDTASGIKDVATNLGDGNIQEAGIGAAGIAAGALLPNILGKYGGRFAKKMMRKELKKGADMTTKYSMRKNTRTPISDEAYAARMSPAARQNLANSKKHVGGQRYEVKNNIQNKAVQAQKNLPASASTPKELPSSNLEKVQYDRALAKSKESVYHDGAEFDREWYDKVLDNGTREIFTKSLPARIPTKGINSNYFVKKKGGILYKK